LPSALPAALAALVLVPVTGAAQSEFHPRWEIPGFDFRENGAWRVRARQVSALRRQLLSQGKIPTLNAPMLVAGGPAPSAASVTGTVAVPVLLFSYNGTPAQFKRSPTQYTNVLFSASPPGGNPYTLRTFYEEMSNGLFGMTGTIMGWVELDSAEVTYTGPPPCSGNPFGSTGCNGLFTYSGGQAGPNPIARMQNGFREALARVDASVDFSQFDNDGPDLVPNSGDDDGYVDMIMFAHASKDGACGPASSSNNHIWSHRFVLANATQTFFQDYFTNDAKFGGGSIKISDYFATSALGGPTACDSTQIMPIGTAAHEFGHALGLPDLYDTRQVTQGIGEWGVMGSGNFTSPSSPSRMEAWSLNELGWVTLVPLTASGTYSFGAAPVSDTAFYVRAQGSNPRGEYFLIENRQASQADTALIRIHCARSFNPPGCGGGMLIWHADSVEIANNGFHRGNHVNADSIHGLVVEEADGLRQLWCGSGCNRGDAGDLYPGVTGNTAFTPTSNPAAVRNSDMQPAGFVLDQITQVTPGGTMSFRLAFPVWMVRATPDTAAFIQFDGTDYRVFRGILSQGSTHTVGVADTQYTAAGRTRQVFVAWSDAQSRIHTYTAGAAPETLTVSLARAHRLDYGATSGGSVAADTAGTAVSSGSFFANGTPVTLTATAGSLPFTSWGGDTVSKNATITLPMRRPYNVRAVFLESMATASVVSQLLTGTGLTSQQQLELDQLGNNNGGFDLGDFLAWVQATGATLAADQRALVPGLAVHGANR
jgi:M6 family metalloprotease-like protein